MKSIILVILKMEVTYIFFLISEKGYKMDSDLLSVMADISNQLELPKTELIDVKPDVPPNLTKIELETTGSELLQGQSWQTGFFELALRDRNMQVRFF